MFPEAELLPLSALQHWLFCPRQCGLIHLEQAWAENKFTAEGQVLHHKAHEGPDECKAGVRITRTLPVRSFRLGISGQCDIVEFHKTGQVIPVEYKRGKPKSHRADEVQLCAQALCLEEMLSVYIPAGALYYGETRRRADVVFDTELRQLTQDTANRLHQMLSSGITSPPFDTAHCSSCSLAGICRPDLTDRRSAKKWLHQQVENALS